MKNTLLPSALLVLALVAAASVNATLAAAGVDEPDQPRIAGDAVLCVLSELE